MNDRTLMEVFEKEYCILNTRVRAAETIRLYECVIRRYGQFLGRDATLADFTDDSLAGFLRHRESLGKSPNTIGGECSKLFALWRWCAKRKLVDTFPTIPGPQEKQPTPTAWSREEIKALLNAAQNAPGTIRNVPRSHYFYCFLLMAWETGERFGALWRLRWEDIDFAERWVVYRGETRKGFAASDNRQRISRQLTRALKTYHELCGYELVFGFADTCSIYHHIKPINQAAGLPTDRRSMFHKMRRSHATHLYVAGGDATVSLGHSSDYITRKCYLDPKYIRRAFGADLLQGFFGRLVNKVKTVFGR